MMLISQNNIAGLNRLVATARRRGASAHAIGNLMEGFSRREVDVAFLVKAISGPRLEFAVQQFSGLPSWRTVGRYQKIPSMLCSVGIPSEDEMSHNISAFYDPDVRPLPANSKPSNVVQVDDIAAEARCRWCPKRDCVLGLCRQHSRNVTNGVDSYDSIENIRVHLYECKDSAEKLLSFSQIFLDILCGHLLMSRWTWQSSWNVWPHMPSALHISGICMALHALLVPYMLIHRLLSRILYLQQHACNSSIQS